jgi:outer membrane protein assembly factor BamB
MKQGANSSRPARGGLRAHRLSQVAALMFVTLLVGSMVVLFRLASNGRSVVSNSPPVVPSAPKESMMFALGGSTLYRLDMKTHQPLWHFQVPAADGRIISLGQVVNDTYYLSSMSKKLYALDVASGKVRWQVDLSFLLIGDQISLVSFGDTLYLPVTKNGSPAVEALAVSTGAKQWEHRLEGTDVSVIAASGQAVYGEMGNNSGRFALSTRDGHVLWQKEEEIAHVSGIDRGFVVDGVLCVLKSNGLGIVVGYNAASGELLWSHSLDSQLSGYGTTLLHGVVYVDTNRQPNQGNSIFYAFSAKDGAQIWRYQDTATSGSSYLTVTEQVVYFYRYSNGHGGQTLVALNTSNGKVRWTYNFHDIWTVEYPPAADNDQVYLSLPDNVIQILRASDGKPLGSFKAPGPVDPTNRVLLQVVG